MCLQNDVVKPAKIMDTKPKERYSIALVHVIVVLMAIFPAYKTMLAGDPLIYMIPNALMFTPYREATISFWRKHKKIDKAVKREPTKIPEIKKEDFSFESLRIATENFRYPALMKGFFKGTPAMEKWTQPGYLSSKIGKYEIPIVDNGIIEDGLKDETGQSKRTIKAFGPAYEELLKDPDDKKYMFFPVLSRFTNVSRAALQELKLKVDDIIIEDLQLDRIFHGFGKHRSFFGAQFIMGRGQNTTKETKKTSGTFWHCAMGNNWFALVAGKKRWYFMDPKYSSYMSPARGGMVNMMTTDFTLDDYMDSIPIRYADVEAGDLLYNPDWEWHYIRNYEGLAIGCPIRELNLTQSFKNNFQYTSIVLINTFFQKVLGVSLGGYPFE